MGTNAAHMTHNGEATAARVAEMMEILVESQRVSEKAARKTITSQLRANQRFAESLADGLVQMTTRQTEAYLDTLQVLVDHSKEQQEVLHELVQSSTRACMDFFFSPFLALEPRIEEEAGRRRGQNGHTLPFEDYDRLNVEEVSQRLAELDAREIEELKTYEKHHKNRTSLMEQFERSLSG